MILSVFGIEVPITRAPHYETDRSHVLQTLRRGQQQGRISPRWASVPRTPSLGNMVIETVLCYVAVA